MTQMACDFPGLAQAIYNETGVLISPSDLRGMDLEALHPTYCGLSADDWTMNNGFIHEHEFSTFTSIAQLISLNPALASQVGK